MLTSENTDELKALISYVNKGRIWFTLVDVKKCTSKNLSLNVKMGDHKYFLDISGNKYFAVAHGNFIYFVHLNDTKTISR